MHVELVSPERILYSGEGDMVICRTPDGEIAFLENHAPFVGALVTAPVRVISGSHQIAAAVHTQLLAPFADVFCFFCDDLGGFQSVAHHIAAWQIGRAHV